MAASRSGAGAPSVEDWPAWVLQCVAVVGAAEGGDPVRVVPTGADRLRQPRFRLTPVPGPVEARRTAVWRHSPVRTVHRVVSGWTNAAVCADRGLGLGVVNAVVRGEATRTPCGGLADWIRESGQRWVDEERHALVRAARWALAVGRWPEAAAIARLLREATSVPPTGLERVERAVAVRRRAAADVVGVVARVLFESGQD